MSSAGYKVPVDSLTSVQLYAGEQSSLFIRESPATDNPADGDDEDPLQKSNNELILPTDHAKHTSTRKWFLLILAALAVMIVLVGAVVTAVVISSNKGEFYFLPFFIKEILQPYTFIIYSSKEHLTLWIICLNINTD